jgi:hypothetical protein
MHVPATGPLSGPLSGFIWRPKLTADAYISAQVFGRRIAAGSATAEEFVPSPSDAHWEPVSNMDPASPALVFDASTGDVVMGWVS